MDTYGQDAELLLLGELLPHLSRRTMIDVGAEQGSVAGRMLQAGVERLYAFDPHPGNAGALRARFADDTRVTVHEDALSDADGSSALYVSSSPNGNPLSFGHTLLERDDTDEIAWKSTVPVTIRSLESLVNAGEIPSDIGILKIDTEGYDLAVVQGMGALQPEVVMVEHWTHLPRGLGVCPWSAEEMRALLRDRGFAHFAFVVHRGEFVTLKWDDSEIEGGVMGNVVFLRDDALTKLMPVVLNCAGILADGVMRVGQAYKQAAQDRAAVIEESRAAWEGRMALVNELHQAAEARRRALEVTTAALEERSSELEALKQASHTS